MNGARLNTNSIRYILYNMHFVRKHWEQLLETGFLIFVFITSQLPLRDFDIWFHIKSGQYFVAHHGLTFAEPFSFAAYGRPWTPYEWLFQVGMYGLSLVGLWTIPPVIAAFITTLYYFFLKILKDIFSLNIWVRLVMTFSLYAAGFEFYTARPHIIAYTFFIITLYLILMRVYKGKNWIWWTPLITLVWTNLHSTAFLGFGFMLVFASIALVRRNFTVMRDLITVACINAAVTILPPLGATGYQLLWKFFTEREFLGHFIAEWSSTLDTLEYNPTGFFIYTGTSVVTIALFLWMVIKEKKWLAHLWGLPFIFTIIMGFTAVRNLYLGTIAMYILISACIPFLSHWPVRFRTRKLLWAVLAIALIVANGELLYLKRQSTVNGRLYYPIYSVRFAAKYLMGNMFNDYTYGGYVLYSVYPTLSVFIDGRSDVYLDHEMPDYLNLSINKNMPDPEYRAFLMSFFDKYHIDFAIIPTAKHNVFRKIGSVISSDPAWALVFWDDSSEIFVKRNGKNDAVIAQFESKAATPYLQNPFDPKNVEQALFEYKRMDAIVKTARTDNAIGFIDMQQGKFTEAKKRFEEALTHDPVFESPYMNLAELAGKDGNLAIAIALYQKAKNIAPDRGLIYIRLGQLMLEQNSDDREAVRALWTEGVKNTIDADAKAKLTSLLSTL